MKTNDVILLIYGLKHWYTLTSKKNGGIFQIGSLTQYLFIVCVSFYQAGTETFLYNLLYFFLKSTQEQTSQLLCEVGKLLLTANTANRAQLHAEIQPACQWHSRAFLPSEILMETFAYQQRQNTTAGP